jgi:hypothetical protein
MSTNPRRQNRLKKVIFKYILLLSILFFALYFLNVFVFSRKPLFISPMGQAGMSISSLEKTLKGKNILLSKITSADDYYEVNIQNNGQVKLSKSKDINQQIASLQRILRELTIEGKSFRSIDFRFSEPIISF